MYDTEARHIIEALRSGIPSQAVGRYFSEARPQIMKRISDELEKVRSTHQPKGMIITGKYGEGKTHLLNTVFGMAHDDRMVVSFLSLSKETPVDKLFIIYQNAMMNSYLPGNVQPGFSSLLDNLTEGSPIANELLAYAAKELETDRLYYVLKCFLSTEDADEKYLLQADLEGDFVGNPVLKRIYRRIFNTPAKFNIPFKKTAHVLDYFRFMSHLFEQFGYQGWVLLFDEAELIGTCAKRTRLKAYFAMADFLFPDASLGSLFSLYAFTDAYVSEVIDGKKEYESLEEVYPDAEEPAKSVLDAITKAPTLLPLTRDEIATVLMSVQELHGKAYEWNPEVSLDAILSATKSVGGDLLRSRIRAAIEFFDQLYQYGTAGKTTINELGKETFEEEAPALDDVLEGIS